MVLNEQRRSKMSFHDFDLESKKSSFLDPFNFHNWQKVTRHWIITQMLDIITTFIAVGFLGAKELNLIVNHFGWIPAIIVKLIVVVGIASFYERFQTEWHFWILPIICWLAVIWNFLVIITEIIL